MNRITLSSAVMDQMWEHWRNARIDSYSLAAIQYFIDEGWDLKYHPDTLSYTILEDQLDFFLLTL